MEESFLIIWKRKFIFVSLLLLQVVFFSLFFYASLVYLPRMLESAKAISDYLNEQVKLDDVSLANNINQQKGMLGEDPLSISRNYDNIIKNFRLYLMYNFALLLAFLSISWTLTAQMLHKTSKRNMAKIFLKNLLISFFCLGVMFWFFLSIVGISFSGAAQGPAIFYKYIPMMVFSVTISYFMFISLSVSGIADWKHLLQATFEIGIKKFHCMLAAYFINILILIILAALLAYSTEGNIFVTIFLMLVFVIFFVIKRIFLFDAIGKLNNKIKN